MDTTSAAILPPSWPQMLAGVEQALAQAEAELRLPELPAEAVEAKAVERADRWQSELRRLEMHGQQLQDRVARAEEQVRGLEAALGQTEERLRAWLNRAQAVRAKLAQQADPSL